MKTIRGDIIKEAHIAQILYNMGNGVTEPKCAFLDDGTEVVIKLNAGPEGNLVLFNEFVCYKLAMLLGIPMPHSGVCIVDSETEIIDTSIVSKKNYGYAFYSTLLAKATILNPGIIHLIENKSVFNRLLLFDHVISNKDRNRGNLLVLFSKYQKNLIAIDHTHVFINGAIWESNCLKRAIEEEDIYSTEILERNNETYGMFYDYVSVNEEILKPIGIEFNKKIDENVISEIIEECPSEWRPSQRNEDALIEYLMYRVKNIDIIISTITNYLKR